ncbi:MAG: hypothetical protein GPJ54_05665 [Candidatus Heimdallarchaeota archaeon]|nr:hypothetical protein [Candidatus Heimdallarchaeota archaeon]
MGSRSYHLGNKRSLGIALLISMLFVTLSGFENVQSVSKFEREIVDSIEIQMDPSLSSNSLEQLTSSQSKIAQTSPTFNINNYESLQGTNLHFSGWIDYNNDSTNDIIFVVEFNSTTSPYDLIILDGNTYEILETYENIAESTFKYTFNTRFIPNPTESLPDLLVSFKADTSNFCNWAFIGTTSRNLGSFEDDCEDYQYVTDWDGNGDLEIVRIDTSGNFWTNNIDENMAKGPNGNLIAFTGIEGSFQNLKFANFTGDNIPDFVLSQPSDDETKTFLYMIDGQTSTVISNTSINGNLDTILTLNIDSTEADEVIYVSGTTTQFFVINSSGFEVPYSNFKSGYLYEISKVVPDLNNDGIDDILLIKEKSLFLIINGADGNILLISSYIGAIENSIPSQRVISFGQLAITSYFILQTNDQGLNFMTYNENEVISQLTFIPWNPTLLSNSLNMSTSEYLISENSIDLNQDIDNDGLTATDEFFLSTDDTSDDSDEDTLSDIEETRLGMNPISNDSDQDGVDDRYEFDNQMNYILDDAGLDYDNDELTNLEEYEQGTDIRNSDTDGDGLPDGWEIKFDYNPLRANQWPDDDNDNLSLLTEYQHGTNPRKNDTDDDGIPDDWEIENILDPNEFQNFTDFDNDGLSALEEYQNNIDPRNSDTDDDGLNDGYEVKNGLDPIRNDAGEDKDRDFLSNRFEERLGSNPNGRFDQMISITIIISTIVGMIVLVISYRRLSVKAKSAGFTNYLQMRSIKKHGFLTLTEFDEAQKMGFNIKEAQVLFNSYGIENVNLMQSQWEKLLQRLDTYLEGSTMANIIETIKEIQIISDYEENLQSSKDDVDQLQINIRKTNQLIHEIDTIIDLISRSKLYPFLNLEIIKITETRTNLHNKIGLLSELDSHYSDTITMKDKWFKPWPALLTIIQMTADRSRLDLEEIRQVLSTDTEHAKQLIKAVLSDNPLIGSYSDASNQFTKGTGVDDYLKFVLDRYGEGET